MHAGGRARGLQAEGGRGKILELLAETRRDEGIAAASLLAAFGSEPDEVDGHYIRANVGALMIVRWMRKTEHQLENLVKLWSKPDG